MRVSQILDNLESIKRTSWDKLNSLKMTRAHNCCEICGVSKLPNQLLTHHLVSLKNGGKDEPDNVIIACGECIEVIHAFQALENAERVFNMDILFFTETDLFNYSINPINNRSLIRILIHRISSTIKIYLHKLINKGK